MPDLPEHPEPFRPQAFAAFKTEKMGKSTLFESDRILVGLNSFEAGQEHALHVHEGMDKVYQVLVGKGTFLLEDRELAMEPGVMLIAPSGVPHGIRNDGDERLVVSAILAPGPGKK
ncbi:MAG: cupin domain-containing protein [bacterium]|nr:cupin [Deltaproteobacteria bacterium]MCP4903755.1 cupin domain-containing protein [bacterium]